MGTARAKVVAREGCPKISPLRSWTQEENLMEQKFTMEDIAARNARDQFDVFGRNDLHPYNGPADVGGILLDRGEDCFAQLFAPGIVPATLDIIGCILDKA